MQISGFVNARDTDIEMIFFMKKYFFGLLNMQNVIFCNYQAYRDCSVET